MNVLEMSKIMKIVANKFNAEFSEVGTASVIDRIDLDLNEDEEHSVMMWCDNIDSSEPLRIIACSNMSFDEDSNWNKEQEVKNVEDAIAFFNDAIERYKEFK